MVISLTNNVLIKHQIKANGEANKIMMKCTDTFVNEQKHEESHPDSGDPIGTELCRKAGRFGSYPIRSNLLEQKG